MDKHTWLCTYKTWNVRIYVDIDAVRTDGLEIKFQDCPRRCRFQPSKLIYLYKSRFTQQNKLKAVSAHSRRPSIHIDRRRSMWNSWNLILFPSRALRSKRHRVTTLTALHLHTYEYATLKSFPFFQHRNIQTAPPPLKIQIYLAVSKVSIPTWKFKKNLTPSVNSETISMLKLQRCIASDSFMKRKRKKSIQAKYCCTYVPKRNEC